MDERDSDSIHDESDQLEAITASGNYTLYVN